MFVELSNNQRKAFIDTEQIYLAYLEVRKNVSRYAGGMYWKKVGGKEYLIRLRDRHGNGSSLGVRNQQTQLVFDRFVLEKQQADEHFASIARTLDEQARINKALRISRMPEITWRVMREIERTGLNNSFLVIGTHALYAYEAMAGVQFLSEVTATSDVDLLWDTRSKLSFMPTADGTNINSLLEILQRADRSFTVMEKQRFRAVNSDGFMVDLIKQTPNPPWKPEKSSVSNKEGDLVATELKNMKWLLSSQRVSQVVIGINGEAATMHTIDPRAFAIFKLWLGNRDGRDPIKKPRDIAQANAVFKLVNEKLPHLKFTDDEMRQFPKEVVEAYSRSHEVPRPGA